jgi:hypothetical protein
MKANLKAEEQPVSGDYAFLSDLTALRSRVSPRKIARPSSSC